MSTPHTPGPWILEFPTGHWVSEVFIRAPEWGCIARIGLSYSLPHWDEPQRANAVLIAAAPDLLTALKRLVAADDAHSTAHAPDGDEIARMIEYGDAFSNARAVIKNAEGL